MEFIWIYHLDGQVDNAAPRKSFAPMPQPMSWRLVAFWGEIIGMMDNSFRTYQCVWGIDAMLQPGSLTESEAYYICWKGWHWIQFIINFYLHWYLKKSLFDGRGRVKLKPVAWHYKQDYQEELVGWHFHHLGLHILHFCQWLFGQSYLAFPSFERRVSEIRSFAELRVRSQQLFTQKFNGCCVSLC